MKKNFLKSIFLSAVILAGSSCRDKDDIVRGDCDDEILTSYNTGLVAYYKFSGGSLNDFSGNGHSGTITGSVVSTVNPVGNADCAMRFGGTANDYIRVVSHTDFDFDGNTPISIVLWYKPEDPLSTGKYQGLFSRGTGLHCPDTDGEFSLGLYDNLKPVFGYNQNSVWDSDIVNHTTDPYNYYLSQGWQNLIAIYDPATANKWSLYRDGNLSQNTSGPCGPTISLSGDIYIGKNFLGSIDDVKVYSHALSAAEINFLKSYVSPCCE